MKDKTLRAFPCIAIAIVIIAAWSQSAEASACPFCTAVRPSFAQRRDAAVVAALGELTAVGKESLVFQLHQVQKGRKQLGQMETVEIAGAGDAASANAKPGTLALLLATESDKTSGAAKLTWTWDVLNEVSYAYVARAPGLDEPAAKRLAYFVAFLEHPDEQLADDAYLEFGHATYDDVALVADKLASKSLREWLLAASVPPERKGFYGLALGLAGGQRERAANAEFLRTQIVKPGSDFRSGFDGLLGGYLIAAGEPGLDLIDRLVLANPKSAEGDVRHAMTALRFYHQYGREIPADRLRRSLRQLLDRPPFAAMAIADLARWQDWMALDRIAALFDKPEFADRATDRAVVGFLRTVPGDVGTKALARMRQRAAQRVADAEKALDAFGGTRQEE
jgi:hypothetical protein